MEEVDDIRKKKVSAELEYRNSMPASSYQQQKLRVCEICSAYLGIHDNDRRLADHFGGKLHLGFIKIREKLDGLLVSFIKILSFKVHIFWEGHKILRNSVAFLEYMNFMSNNRCRQGRTRLSKFYAFEFAKFVRPIWAWYDILINILTKSSSSFSWLLKFKYSEKATKFAKSSPYFCPI